VATLIVSTARSLTRCGIRIGRSVRRTLSGVITPHIELRHLLVSMKWSGRVNAT
jgi:hypothetical protein